MCYKQSTIGNTSLIKLQYKMLTCSALYPIQIATTFSAYYGE